MTTTRPPNLFIRRAEGTYHFEDYPDTGYCFVGLKRAGDGHETPFHRMTRDEQDAGWNAFDDFFGKEWPVL